MSLTVGELCAGISGFGLGFTQAGFAVKWWCEIDPKCRSVLQSKYPGIDSHDDISTFQCTPERRVDVLTGGTPCQGFSIAGERRSMQDDRSNLCLHFCRIADELDPAVIVWENVPGVLSTKDNAFGNFLARMVGADAALIPPKECGGRWTNAGVVDGPRRTAAWRILDSQYFGLAQRRRRVFVVACPDPGRANPFQILFEPEGVRGNPPSRSEERQGVTAPLESRASAGGGFGTDFSVGGGLQPAERLIP